LVRLENNTCDKIGNTFSDIAKFAQDAQNQAIIDDYYRNGDRAAADAYLQWEQEFFANITNPANLTRSNSAQAQGAAQAHPPSTQPSGPVGQRTSAENAAARNYFKNNKDAARRAWEKSTGQKWPTDENGNPWPAEHTPSLKSGGDPMKVYPRDPCKPDPHNIPGDDGLTDYQRWGAQGTPARQVNKGG
jgi:hypothetical protein